VDEDIDVTLAERAIARFEELRGESVGLDKKPSTGELIVWMRMLLRAGVKHEQLASAALAELPFPGTLIKNESDLKRLAS